MASQTTNQHNLVHPNTDVHGYGWHKRADFEGFVEDQHYMVHRTAQCLVNLLSKDGETAVKEENSLTVAEKLTEAVKAALKNRYHQNMASDKPKTYKQIIDSFYFTFERMDLSPMVQQAYKKMREKEKQENEEAVIDALSHVILDCMNNAQENHADDFQ